MRGIFYFKSVWTLANESFNVTDKVGTLDWRNSLR
jgi:hypothetical protein